jgi:hypothetical protein
MHSRSEVVCSNYLTSRVRGNLAESERARPRSPDSLLDGMFIFCLIAVYTLNT